MWTYDAASAKSDIWNLHLNEIDPSILTNDSKDIKDTNRPFVDPRTKRVVEHLEVNWRNQGIKSNIQLFMDFPIKSHLRRNQHQDGLRALQSKSKEVLSESDRLAIMKYEEDKPLIAKDRKEFDVFVDSYVDSKLRERFANPSKSIMDVGRLASQGDSSVFESSYFAIQTAIHMDDPTNEFVTHSRLQSEEELKAFGFVQRIFFRSETPLMTTISKNETIAQRFLLKDPETTRDYNTFIGSLGRRSGGFFLTTDVISKILSASEESSWVVPFLIQNSDSGEPFVYFKSRIEKPSCPLDLERLGLGVCYQAAILGGRSKAYSFDKDKFVNVEEETEKVESDNEDEEENSRLVIEEEEDQPMEEGIETEEASPKSSPQETDTVEYKLIKIEEYLLKNEKNTHQEPVNYILSKFQLKSQSSEEALPLIVTSSCSGRFKKQFVSLSFKLEYKSEFGAQKMTLDELIREWSSIAFSSRLNHVLRIRIDYSTSIIIAIDVLDQKEIQTEMERLYGIKPEVLLTRLSKVLSLVTRFPVGKYLLDKEPNSSQIMVYMETDRSDCGKTWTELVTPSVILTSNHKRPSFVEQPIDDQVVTQLHRIRCALPGCIPPLTRQEWTTQLQQKRNAQMPKQKIKGKPPVKGAGLQKSNKKAKKKRKPNKKPQTSKGSS